MDHSKSSNNPLINGIMTENVFSWLERVNKESVFIIWKTTGEIVHMSKNIEKILGYKPHELQKKEWLKNLPKERVEDINKFFDKPVEGNRITTIKLHKQNNVEQSFECMISSLKNDADDSLSYICKLKPINRIQVLEKELNLLREKAVYSEKMALAGELSSGLIHEIRNPITSIKGFLQLVQAGVEQKEEYYRVMIEEIDKIEEITTELLVMSKPFSDNMKRESVTQMINETVFLMKLQSSFKHVLFEVNYSDEPTTLCNKLQIKQVFINLFKNAAEAMNMTGKIVVNINQTDTAIEIDIKDEGTGIPSDTISEISKPFYTTKETGTGLGLMVTNHILQKHNAELKVLPNQPKGSILRISIPRDTKS